MSTEWKDLNNDLSDPTFTNTPLFSNITKSVITQLPNFKFNFFPFKVVNLQWLLAIDKAAWSGNQPTDNEYRGTIKGNKHFAQMTFNGTENYLPVGDSIVDDSLLGGQTAARIFILLVKNSPEYSTIISDENWEAFGGDSNNCNSAEKQWAFRTVKNRMYQGNYTVIGDTIVTGDNNDWWWKRGNSSLNVMNTQPRFFAAVKNQYLNNIANAGSKKSIMSMSGDYDCSNWFDVDATSQFNTFVVGTDSMGGYHPNFPFFDIIPRKLITACCSGIIPDTVLNPVAVCGVWSQSSSTCKISMPNYCATAANLNTPECRTYCLTNNCDIALRALCNVDTDYPSQKAMYLANPELCSCFMSPSFYKNLDDETYTRMGSAGQKLVGLLQASGVYGGPPECSNLVCKSGNPVIQHSTFKNVGTCPSVAIQNCINDAATNNKGTINANQIDASQANNCTQSVAPTTAPPSVVSPSSVVAPPSVVESSPYVVAPPSVVESPPSDIPNNMTLYLIIGVVLLLLLLLLIMMLYLMMK